MFRKGRIFWLVTLPNMPEGKFRSRSGSPNPNMQYHPGVAGKRDSGTQRILWLLHNGELERQFAELDTPLKTNMEPKNGVLEDDFPLKKQVIFRFHVNFPGCTRSRSQCFQTTFFGGFCLFSILLFSKVNLVTYGGDNFHAQWVKLVPFVFRMMI